MTGPRGMAGVAMADPTDEDAGDGAVEEQLQRRRRRECLEVAVTAHAILIRDSKDTTRPGLTVGRADWARFVRYVTEAA
ncbi:DUF397 domain-containing protein [Streptomyces sp. MK37H]|uniref:DUF397 domain-containing protein n=1 Tax=Streptomyces sp. MK37H TaxID=2699117 RepID=UPI0027E55C9B|nr:DUF397 domain-containing protein [Streptomyces sp. MK37H]